LTYDTGECLRLQEVNGILDFMIKTSNKKRPPQFVFIIVNIHIIGYLFIIIENATAIPVYNFLLYLYITLCLKKKGGGAIRFCISFLCLSSIVLMNSNM